MTRVLAVIDDVTVTSTDTASTIKLKAHLKNSNTANSWGAGLKFYINGSLVGTTTGYSTTTGGTFASGTFSKSINKKETSQSIAVKVVAYSTTVNGYSGCGNDNIDPKTLERTATVPALQSWNVIYYANGADNTAPATQKKYYGKTLTLSTQEMIKVGSTFLGWGTSATATTYKYKAGGSYSTNSGISLYAIFSSNTFTVTYNANGGSGAPTAQVKQGGQTLTLSNTTPTRDNYTFKGWGTSAETSVVSYSPGAMYSTDADIILYAIWEENKKPSIISLNTKYSGRVADTSTYNISDDGIYGLFCINYYYQAETITGTRTLKMRKTNLTTEEVTNWSSNYSNQTESSGTYYYRHTAGTFDIDTAYLCEFTLTDSAGSSNTISFTIPKRQYTFQVAPPGDGIAIGDVAQSGEFRVGWDTNIDGTVNIRDEVTIRDDTTIDGDLSVTGAITGDISSYFENETLYYNFNSTYFGNYNDNAENRPTLRKWGNMRMLSGIAKTTSNITGGTTEYLMTNILSTHAPHHKMYFLCQGSSTNVWLLSIDIDGKVYFSRYRYGGGTTYNTTNSNTWLPFCITWIH